jgi:ATP-dependent Lhr-like helicase
VRPVSQQEWEQFLQSWWHLAEGTQLHGRAGVAEVIEQLQGSEWPAGEWERILAARVESYRPEWLDDLCLSGEVTWGRLSLLERASGDERAVDGDGPGEEAPGWTAKTPSRRTPITFMFRHDLPWLLEAHRGGAQPAEPTGGPGRDVLGALRARGALFHSDLQAMTGRLPTEVEEGLWDGVARGLITADGFNAIRSLLHARTRFARRHRPYPRTTGSRGRRGSWRNGVEGRWTLLPDAHLTEDADELAEMAASQLLLRWGVVFRDVYLKERLAIPWREILWALRRLEARGLITGGYFVTGITGEQFAHETTIPLLRGRRSRASHAQETARSSAGAEAV